MGPATIRESGSHRKGSRLNGGDDVDGLSRELHASCTTQNEASRPGAATCALWMSLGASSFKPADKKVKDL